MEKPVDPLGSDTGSSHSRSASSKAGVGLIFLRHAGLRLWDDCNAQTVEGVAVEPDWAAE